MSKKRPQEKQDPTWQPGEQPEGQYRPTETGAEPGGSPIIPPIEEKPDFNPRGFLGHRNPPQPPPIVGDE